jgi:hypothetical protein
MENGLDDLFLRFQIKGFLPIEISGLIKDVSCTLNNHKYFTLTDINRELEELGWGIDIIDNVTYELISSIAQ